jgi:hypothetical protein
MQEGGKRNSDEGEFISKNRANNGNTSSPDTVQSGWSKKRTSIKTVR